MVKNCLTCNGEITLNKIVTCNKNGLEEVELITECLLCRILRREKHIKKELNKNVTFQRKRVTYLEELLKLRKLKNNYL